MTPEIATCLVILGLAVVVFAWDRVPADVVALGVMLGVIATGPAAARQGLRRLQQRHRDDDPRAAGDVGGPDPDRGGRGRRPLRVRHGGAQPGDLPAGHHGVGGGALGVHEQHGGHRLLRAAGDRLRRQDRRQPVALPAAAGVRFDPHQLGDAHQHLDQPGGQRPVRQLPAAADGHVRDGAGRHPDRHPRRALCVGCRRAADPAARQPGCGREDRRAHLPGRRAGDAGQPARRQDDRGRQAHIGYRDGGGEAGTWQGGHGGHARAERGDAGGGRRAANRGPARGPAQDQGHQGARVQGRRAPGRCGRGRGDEGGQDHRGGRAAAALAADRAEPAQPRLQGALWAGGAGHPPGRPAAGFDQRRAPAHGRRAAAAGVATEREGAGAGQPVQHLRQRADGAAQSPARAAGGGDLRAGHRGRRRSSSPRCRWRCWAARSSCC